ncbi:hypothetical protein NE237_021898 [Protea cynaroides]|uniref:AB hydrolase-1 domain-containing protein n=1 Tax=Protea cynaroides TaxID=273540 RepID=A0A9Q0HC31_9MAGN|nr:hypothetical protein NE237_021898 [Protea cynaroides]
MGNLFACFSSKEVKKKPPKRYSNPPSAVAAVSSNRSNRNRYSKRENREDSLTQEQALAAALLLHQHQQNGTPSFDRSASLRYPAPGSKQSLPRSSSSRPRSLTDPLVQPHQLVNQDLKLDDLETRHFVLVHGGGFGAWCWYKTIALLEESGFNVDAVDLTGSGIHSYDSNSITSLSQYVKPLTTFLEKLGNGEKVILVGHDIGGACISYAMELFPFKVAKAVFIAASMLTSGQSALEMFSQQADSNDLLRSAQIFLYANGKDYPPTAIDLDKALLRDLLFNQSPAKDVALASVSMRPIPFAPVLEKLSLSDSNYGSVRRFYIETPEDNAIPLSLQQNIINSNFPEKVFRLKGSDHSPFFSKPQALHKRSPFSCLAVSCLALRIYVLLSRSDPKNKVSLSENRRTERKRNRRIMGRGVSSGGGQSSLGYLFGSGEAPTPAAKQAEPAVKQAEPAQNQGQDANNGPSQKLTAASQPVDNSKQIPAGIQGNTANNANNYFRADGPNSGNFITDRPSTKVHSAPGGGSSLNYLFGGSGGDLVYLSCFMGMENSGDSWHDHRILDLERFRVASPRPEQCSEEWVSDLITDSDCWNISRMRTLFLDQEVEASTYREVISPSFKNMYGTLLDFQAAAQSPDLLVESLC